MIRRRGLALLFVAPLAACSGGSSGTPPPSDLAILSFTAQMSPVEAGATTTLSWSVQGAASVLIEDDLGERLVDGPELTGSVETPPIEADRVYTLTALRGGDFARAEVEVDLATDTRPRVARFEANPSTIISGETTELQWGTRNTTSVRIETEGGEVILPEGIDAGLVEVEPATTTTYVLTASRPGEPDGTAMTTVTVEGPRIDVFTVSSTVVAVGGAITLEYETTGAESVRLLRAGEEFSSSTEGDGEFFTPVVEGAVEHVLEASNPAGTTEQSLTILGVGPPRIEQFTVSSVISTLDEPITVSWDVRGVTSLRLIAAGTPVPGFEVIDRPDGALVDASGSLEVSLMNDGIISLRAETIGGEASESAFIDFFEPLRLDEDGEVVEVVIPAGADVSLPLQFEEERYLVAESFSSRGNRACGFDTVFTLQTEDGTVLGGDDDDGVDLCSRIDGTDEFARLEAGQYRLVAQAKDPDEEIDVDLVLSSQPVDVCGNGFVEAAESCDDGNTDAGDGCSAGCQTTVNLSGNSINTFTDLRIPIAGDLQLDLAVTSTVYIDIETFSDAMLGECDNLNTFVRIIDDQGERVADANSGLNFCSRIGPPNQAAILEPGGYIVQVTESNGQAVSSFDVVLETIPFGVCGNDFRDGGELCDDGNTMNGDLCASNCIPTEGIQQLGFDPDATFMRSLQQGERSPFLVEVTQPSTLTAETFSNASTGSCNVNLTMRLIDSTGAVILQGGGGCPDFSVDDPAAALDPGVYAVEVVPGFSPGFPIQFEIRLRLTTIECGNFIVEQGETCDDGNTVSGDGCDDMCIIEPICGDLEIDPPELCDDGNLVNGDGCDSDCEPEEVVTGGVGTSRRLIGRTVPLSGTDFVQLTTTATVQVSIETFEDSSMGTCASINTFVELFDAQATSVVANDDDGVNLCSLIDFGPLAPGDYVIRTTDPTVSSSFDFDMDINLSTPPP